MENKKVFDKQIMKRLEKIKDKMADLVLEIEELEVEFVDDGGAALKSKLNKIDKDKYKYKYANEGKA